MSNPDTRHDRHHSPPVTAMPAGVVHRAHPRWLFSPRTVTLCAFRGVDDYTTCRDVLRQLP